MLSLGLTWSLLIGYLALAYVIVIAVGSQVLGHPIVDYDPPWWMNLLALVLSAPTFLPVYRWLRTGVRELVYSQQEHPYPTLTRLNRQLDQAPTPQTMLANIAETIALALKLPYVEIEASQTGEATTQMGEKVRYGSQVRGAALVRMPLEYHGQQMGEMLVSTRSARETLSAADLSLLHDLARHVSGALYTSRLSQDLQHARQRLVIAREEERRRIRNDLHDGLAPTLSSLQMQLGAVRSLLCENPERAEALINELREDLRGATAEIRQLVYDLRPPRLDDLGLLDAIKSIRFPNGVLQVDVIAPEPFPDLSAAVEAASFFIASEALHNVAKHAQATKCEVQIDVIDDQLTLKVCDNGKHFPHEKITPGVGLRSMRERAVELGGDFFIEANQPAGICVIARIPLGQGTKQRMVHFGNPVASDR